MAKLSKEQYERRNEAATGRVLDNIEIAKEQGMTDEQGELIFDLCRLRHELHCNVNALIISAECSEWSIVRELIDVNHKLLEAGLEQPLSEDEINDIDCIDTCYDIGCNRMGNPIPKDHDSKEHPWSKRLVATYE